MMMPDHSSLVSYSLGDEWSQIISGPGRSSSENEETCIMDDEESTSSLSSDSKPPDYSKSPRDSERILPSNVDPRVIPGIKVKLRKYEQSYPVDHDVDPDHPDSGFVNIGKSKTSVPGWLLFSQTSCSPSPCTDEDDALDRRYLKELVSMPLIHRISLYHSSNPSSQAQSPTGVLSARDADHCLSLESENQLSQSQTTLKAEANSCKTCSGSGWIDKDSTETQRKHFKFFQFLSSKDQYHRDKDQNFLIRCPTCQ